MQCEEVQALFGQLALGELDGEAKDGLAAHLKRCDGCRGLAEDARVAARLLREGVEVGPAPVLSEHRRQALLSAAAGGEDAELGWRAWAFVKKQILAGRKRRRRPRRGRARCARPSKSIGC